MARWPTLVAALALLAAVSTAETQGKKKKKPLMTNILFLCTPEQTGSLSLSLDCVTQPADTHRYIYMYMLECLVVLVVR